MFNILDNYVLTIWCNYVNEMDLMWLCNVNGIGYELLESHAKK